MEVVPLVPQHDCHDIAKALRNIADQVEKGEYDFDPTLAVVVIGRESQRITPEGPVDNFSWTSHGLGKISYFASKGLLAAALNHFESSP